MTTDTATAQREADQAHADVRSAEADIVGGRRRIGPGKLVDLVTRARHADLTAQAAHQAAERARSDARKTALIELGKQIDAAAAGAGADIAEALVDVAGACAKVRALAAAHDATVSDLMAAALGIGAHGPVPGGVRRADEGIAVGDGAVRHGTIVLQPVGPQLGPAIAHAIAGDVISAQAAIRATLTAAVPQRADRYFRGRGGMLLPIFGDLSPIQMAQVGNGDLVELSESEILRYLDGERV
jgi:hypothetical protein